MRSPVNPVNWLKSEWQPEWEAHLKAYYGESQEPIDLEGDRYLRRSVLPHISNLSEHFNRLESDGKDQGISKYWKKSSNNSNQLAAYASFFSPQNAMRVAAVLHEMRTHGLADSLGENINILDMGAGTGAATLGAHLAFLGSGVNLCSTLLESNQQALKLGQSFLNRVAPNLEIKTKHQSLENVSALTQLGFERRDAMDLWISSFFINELHWSAADCADILLRHWKRTLKPNGIAVFVEPALQVQSRRLLELREALIQTGEVQILRPCLDNRPCGALVAPRDWCHERISWWRPKVVMKLDALTKLDHKELAFTYLVLKLKPKGKVLSTLDRGEYSPLGRMISEVKDQKNALSGYACFSDAKKYVRFSNPSDDTLNRGHIVEVTEGQGSPEAFHAKKWREVYSTESFEES